MEEAKQQKTTKFNKKAFKVNKEFYKKQMESSNAEQMLLKTKLAKNNKDTPTT